MMTWHLVSINQKKASVAILIWDKINLKAKSISEEGHTRKLKGSIYQDILNLNLYVPNTISVEYINSKLSDLYRKPDKSIIIEDVNIPLSITETSSK